ITFSMSCDYELENRIEDKDSRRMIFDKQEELLGKLDETWKERKHGEYQQILKSYPFDDLAGLRATLSRQLRQQGSSEIEINKLVYEKYPC
ncbi:MAG: immunity 63 family protein, partial [Tannerella sp.]|nr:immunity 63 family protein [Tannerella sp.]